MNERTKSLNKKQANRKTRRFMPREYGPANFAEMIRGLAAAAKKIQLEEQLIFNFDPQGKLVN